MVAIKTNNFSLESTIRSQLSNEDKVIGRYNVIPLDNKVSNYLSSQIFLSTKKLFVYYDETLEIYNLSDISIEHNEIEPNFEFQGLLLEGNFSLRNNPTSTIYALRQSDNVFKLSIAEPNTLAKDFIFRQSFSCGKNYQTWALYQILKSTKDSSSFNPILNDFLNSGFSNFQPQLLLKIMYIVIAFVIIKILLSFFDILILQIVTDIIFIGILGYTGYRLLMLFRQKLSQLQRVYMSYKSN